MNGRFRAGERMPRRVRARHDAEVEPEKGTEFALPVSDETGRGDDQHAPDPSAHEHLAHVEPGHDRLARARVVREQEAEGLLYEHVLVDRDPLVGQRIDTRDLARKRWIELIAVRQPETFHKEREPVRVTGEIEEREVASTLSSALKRVRSAKVSRAMPSRVQGVFLLQFAKPPQRQLPGTRLARLPPMDGDDRNAEPLSKALLG